MGKKLVIKGADFSQNGFTYEIVKKEVTSLYKSDGTVVTDESPLVSSETVYFAEKTDGSLYFGTNMSRFCYSTTPSMSGLFIDVEDYTDAEITTVCNFSPYGNIAGFAIMFFLDSSKNIIGGFSSGPSQNGCENKGASDDKRTLKMSIPTGSKYVVCTYCSDANTVDDFKLVLSKMVIS